MEQPLKNSDDPEVAASSALASLFTPLTIRGLDLANRIAMAPMTRKRSPGGVPGVDVARYYERRAAHGVGLIFSEGIAIDHAVAADHPDVPHLSGTACQAGWSRVVSSVHKSGGRIVAQLWHVGSLRRGPRVPNPSLPSVSPSAVRERDDYPAVAMSEVDIGEVIESFARSSRIARELGFDGIEIHAAHGYLIDQFVWKRTNLRTDRYGGDISGRTRFAAEVVRACRESVGNLPMFLRFSQSKLQDYEARIAESPEELAAFLQPLVGAGVDAFDCSTRVFSQPAFPDSGLTLAGWTRRLTGKPVVAVGSVGQTGDFLTAAFGGNATLESNLRTASQCVIRGEFDLVAIGRALLADSEWAAKVGRGDFNPRPFTRAALASLD